MFFIAYFIVALACFAITLKTMIGYTGIRKSNKIIIAAIFAFGWFSPLIISALRNITGLPNAIFSSVSVVGYTLMGFSFIVFCLILLRDIFWYGIYGLARAMGKDGWSLNPKNISVLGRANFIIVIISTIISVYAFYQGTKIPDFKNIRVEHHLLKNDIRLVQISDLHINRSTPVSRIHKIVNAVNNTNPDLIVLTGDIVDDDTFHLQKHLDALQNMSSSYGVYASIGNHEFYNGLSSWIYEYQRRGINLLFNQGATINDNIFVAGVPDAFTANSNPSLNINFTHTLSGSNRDQYRVLLSHNPEIANSISSYNFQMMLSGHTHGGQLFPFHIFVKKSNQYLSGEYDVNGIKLYVSNGAGTWGPSMRLFAPSEITVIDLIKKEK
ncbi:MAG: metallophosphoesterase [Alphaproteobacteria bacterium]|nr:metallophosphoesterase [Alphaproteobacteria bacterium]